MKTTIRFTVKLESGISRIAVGRNSRVPIVPAIIVYVVASIAVYFIVNTRMTVLYIPEQIAAHKTSNTPVSNENSVACVSVTAARPQKHIKTPIQHMGFTISFRNIRVKMRVKIGDDAMIKLLTPAETLTEPVLNKYEYKNTPERPLAINIGISLAFGRLIFFSIPIMIIVIEAVVNLNTISATGL